MTSPRDGGKGLTQAKAADGHWIIEGYDVYPYAHWEGTHTSRGAHIEKDGARVHHAGDMSDARRWIRTQTGKPRSQP
jgi:hypothetical protein